jgi:hypothetical protein
LETYKIPRDQASRQAKKYPKAAAATEFHAKTSQDYVGSATQDSPPAQILVGSGCLGQASCGLVVGLVSNGE